MIAFDDEAAKQAEAWDYTIALPSKANPEDKFTVKGSQFEQPLLEFSGSCGGCAETAYARLITQLFGDRMYIAKRNRLFFNLGWFCSYNSLHY